LHTVVSDFDIFRSCDERFLEKWDRGDGAFYHRRKMPYFFKNFMMPLPVPNFALPVPIFALPVPIFALGARLKTFFRY